MPCTYHISGVESDPRKWEYCKRTISKEMTDSGWNKHAGKFSEVMNRKARKMFYKTK